MEEASDPAPDIWPDNLMSVNVFIGMQTQWRVGVNGATGLEYQALPFVMRMVGVPRKDQPNVFQDIRTMEDAAIETIRKE